MRRKRHEEHVNHEAWAIPYADLMTLLLAFFVVMYAVSVVNAGKYRVMSQSMADAFNGHAVATAPATPAAGVKPPLPLRPPMSGVAPLPSGSLVVPLHPPSATPMPESSGKSVALQRIENQVQRAMQPLIDKKLVILRHMPGQLEIEIRTDILYSSGAAKLSTSANHVLVSLASILAQFPNSLRVEGFTDNLPIRTTQYPSNWELSAARAASVARLFVEQGVERARLGIVGWGDVRPVADNATAEGRQRNRRVLIVVEGDRAGPGRLLGEVRHPGEVSGSVAAIGTVTALPTRIVSAHASSPDGHAGAEITPVSTGDVAVNASSPFNQPRKAAVSAPVVPPTPAMARTRVSGTDRSTSKVEPGPP